MAFGLPLLGTSARRLTIEERNEICDLTVVANRRPIELVIKASTVASQADSFERPRIAALSAVSIF